MGGCPYPANLAAVGDPAYPVICLMTSPISSISLCAPGAAFKRVLLMVGGALGDLEGPVDLLNEDQAGDLVGKGHLR
jgi:hypothetical protein